MLDRHKKKTEQGMCEQIEGGFTQGFPGGNVYYRVHGFVEQDKTFSPNAHNYRTCLTWTFE